MEKVKKENNKDVSMKWWFKERYISWEYGYHLWLWLPIGEAERCFTQGHVPSWQPTSNDYRVHAPSYFGPVHYDPEGPR